MKRQDSALAETPAAPTPAGYDDDGNLAAPGSEVDDDSDDEVPNEAYNELDADVSDREYPENRVPPLEDY